MTDDRDDDDELGVPDSDPRQIDPAGDVADLFESGDVDASLANDTDREQLEEFVRRAESGEFDADPGLEATVRIVRSLLDQDESNDGDADLREE